MAFYSVYFCCGGKKGTPPQIIVVVLNRTLLSLIISTRQSCWCDVIALQFREKAGKILNACLSALPSGLFALGESAQGV